VAKTFPEKDKCKKVVWAVKKKVMLHMQAKSDKESKDKEKEDSSASQSLQKLSKSNRS
jgi:hypothetical protein